MPKKPVDEDRARRKELLEQKKVARKLAAEKEKAEAEAKERAEEAKRAKQLQKLQQDGNSGTDGTSTKSGTALALTQLPMDAMHVVLSMLSAADLGRVTATGSQVLRLLSTARTSYLQSRLHQQSKHLSVSSSLLPLPSLRLCATEQQARDLLLDAFTAGGDTGRIVAAAKKKLELQDVLQFVGYARFLEEVVTGYSLLQRTIQSATDLDDDEEIETRIRLPAFVKGRMASASPEHSLVRVGGDAVHCGPGGSGVASQGVGKRGQLGHGNRDDCRTYRRLLYGIGYRRSLRIVQVAAGGGLVRVAHSLLLTDAGRVLSFGTGQYGALGHGFSAAKQLPDCLQPTLIAALAHVRCICIAAGELHSAAVSEDADVYTWGDGFCGQLGHGDKRPCVVPKLVETGGLDEECIANVTCGSRHTIVVTENNQAYSWGLGHFGVLGRSYTPFEYDADAAVVIFPGADDDGGAGAGVVAAAAAPPDAADIERDAAAALAAHLDLIANLTLDDSSNQCIPMLIDSLESVKIIGASAGHRHSLLLDEQGYLYSFGAGSSGCLGHGDTESHMFPCRIQAFDDEYSTKPSSATSGHESTGASTATTGDCVRIRQMSAGVDMSMAVSTAGHVYAWGKTDRGRIGLGMVKSFVTLPRRVYWNPSTAASSSSDDPNGIVDDSPKAVDVECGYVHSLIVGLNGTLHVCGRVGVDGEEDGEFPRTGIEGEEQELQQLDATSGGRPMQVPDLNIWHRTPEPKEEQVKKERWQKMGKYEVKGRSKNVNNNE